MAQPDGKQALILTILRLQVLCLVLVIADPRLGAVAVLLVLCLVLCSRGRNILFVVKKPH